MCDCRRGFDCLFSLQRPTPPHRSTSENDDGANDNDKKYDDDDDDEGEGEHVFVLPFHPHPLTHLPTSDDCVVYEVGVSDDDDDDDYDDDNVDDDENDHNNDDDDDDVFVATFQPPINGSTRIHKSTDYQDDIISTVFIMKTQTLFSTMFCNI